MKVLTRHCKIFRQSTPEFLNFALWGKMIEEELCVDCDRHGKNYAAIVCRHLLIEKNTSLGFIENSSEPSDYQAWCNKCESMYLKEKDRTAKFKIFNDPAIVCEKCYMEIKEIHDKNP